MSLLQSKKKKKRGDAPHFGSLWEAFSLLKLALPPVNRRGAVWPRGDVPHFGSFGEAFSLLKLALPPVNRRGAV